jgi:hypothetical protein
MDSDDARQLICDKPPALVSRIHHGQARKAISKNVVSDFGPFKSVVFPEHWIQEEPYPDVIEFYDSIKRTSAITIGIAMKRPNEKSGNAFVQLLSDAASGKQKRLLYKAGEVITPEIRRIFDSLSFALTYDRTGGNQLTTPGPKIEGDPGPPYVVDRAEIITINGKDVLSVSGSLTYKGKRTNYDESIFVPFHSAEGIQTYSLNVYGHDKEQLGKLQPFYRAALASIDWR